MVMTALMTLLWLVPAGCERPPHPEEDKRWLLGSAHKYMADGEPDYAIEQLTKFLAVHPANKEARMLLEEAKRRAQAAGAGPKPVPGFWFAVDQARMPVRYPDGRFPEPDEIRKRHYPLARKVKTRIEADCQPWVFSRGNISDAVSTNVVTTEVDVFLNLPLTPALAQDEDKLLAMELAMCKRIDEIMGLQDATGSSNAFNHTNDTLRSVTFQFSVSVADPRMEADAASAVEGEGRETE
jgi:hypothetical protein